MVYNFWLVNRDSNLTSRPEGRIVKMFDKKGLMGIAWARNNDKDDRKEHIYVLGVLVRKDARHKGNGKRLIKRMIEDLKIFSYAKIVIAHYSDNKAMAKICKSLGFKLEAKLRKEHFAGNGVYRDIWQWAYFRLDEG